MFINKVLELYREACKHGLSVSLSINNMNGQESFSLATIPGPDLAGRPERRRRPRGGRRQRRHRQDQQESDHDNLTSYDNVSESVSELVIMLGKG